MTTRQQSRFTGKDDTLLEKFVKNPGSGPAGSACEPDKMKKEYCEDRGWVDVVPEHKLRVPGVIS